MQSQNLQNQSTNQPDRAAEIKTLANDAVNTLWKFETLTNFQLQKLHHIQNVLQALLFEKINVQKHSIKQRINTDAIAHALEMCQDLRSDFLEETYNLSANNELFNIEEALFYRLQGADISNIPEKTPYSN